jgi:hypothetical protein
MSLFLLQGDCGHLLDHKLTHVIHFGGPKKPWLRELFLQTGIVHKDDPFWFGEEVSE